MDNSQEYVTPNPLQDQNTSAAKDQKEIERASDPVAEKNSNHGPPPPVSENSVDGIRSSVSAPNLAKESVIQRS